MNYNSFLDGFSFALKFDDLSKKYQLILAMTILLIVISVGFSFLLPMLVNSLMMDEFKKFQNSIVQLTSDNLWGLLSISYAEESDYREATSGVESLPYFTHILVYDTNNIMVYRNVNPNVKTQIQLFRPSQVVDSYEENILDLYVVNRKIFKQDKLCGSVVVVFSVSDIRNSIDSLQLKIVFACAVVLIIGIFFTFIISGLISKPLEILLTTFNSIAKGNLSVRAEISTKEEFGQLSMSFNRMVDSLEESYYELADTNKNMEMIVEQRTKQLRSQVEVRTAAEEKLRSTNKMVSSIINTSPLPIVTLGVTFNVKSASPAYKQIFQYEEYEILEKELPFLFSQDIEYFKNSLHDLQETKTAEKIVAKGVRKNGELIDLSIAAVAEYSPNNKVTGYIVIIDDITERIISEKALRDSEAKYRSLIEDSFVGIGIVKETTFFFVNNALQNIWEYEDKVEFMNVPLLDLVVEEDKHKLMDLFKMRDAGTTEDNEKKSDIDVKIICYNGKEKYVQIDSSIIMLDDDALLQMTFLDITDRYIAEQKLKNVNEELEQRVIDRTSKLNKTLIDLRNEMSQRNKLTKQLQEKSETLDSTISICIVFDKNGNCSYISPYTLKIFEQSESKLLEKGFWNNVTYSTIEGTEFNKD